MNKEKKVVIFGVGQIADVAAFYMEYDSEYQVVAYCVDREFLKEETHNCCPVVAFETIEETYPPSEYYMFIPISYKHMNRHRAEHYFEAKNKGYKFATYISSRAYYYGTEVGENCFILEGNVLQPFSKIGDDTILWSGNHVGHHTTIGSHCFIASHVVVSGSVNVGDYCFLGVNSTIRDNINIGKYNLIGAGSLILHDTKDKQVFTNKGTISIQKESTDIKNI